MPKMPFVHAMLAVDAESRRRGWTMAETPRLCLAERRNDSVEPAQVDLACAREIAKSATRLCAHIVRSEVCIGLRPLRLDALQVCESSAARVRTVGASHRVSPVVEDCDNSEAFYIKITCSTAR
jgi:hypothetical protein